MQGIQSFVYLNRILGLCPSLFSCKESTSRISSTLPILLALVLYILSLNSVTKLPKITDKVTIMVHLLQFVPNSVSYLVWMCNILRNRILFYALGQSLEDLDEKLGTFCCVNVASIVRGVRKAAVIVTFVALFLGLSAAVIQFCLQVDTQKIWTLFYWYSNFIPEFSMILVTLQCSGWIYSLSKRVQMFHGKINELSGIDHTKVQKHPIIFTSPENPLLIKVFKQLPQHVFDLQQCLQKISNYYGKQIVLNYFSAFISVTAKLYFFILMIRFLTEENISAGKLMKLIVYLLFVGMHTLELGVSMWSGSFAKSQWNSLTSKLQEILLKVKDETMREAVSESLVAIGESPFEFSAADFFVLDFQLIGGILSSIVTYLVVLVQFQMESDKEDITSGLPFLSESLD